MNDDSVDDQMPVTTNESSDGVATSTGAETLIGVEARGVPSTSFEVTVPDGGPSTSTSFSEFYLAERPTIVRGLSLVLQDQDFGADAADEAFVRACQQWPNVRHLTNPAGWVYRVGLNWANSALRRKRRHRAKAALLARADATVDRPGDLDLQRALSELSDTHRAVVICRYYLDWSTEQTSEALGVPGGTVKSRLARALSQLESLLEPPSPTIENGIDR